MTVMRKLILPLSVAVLVAGCAKKAPTDLPPPPPLEAAEADAGVGESGARAGSQADFLARVTSDRIFFDTDQSTVDAEDQAILRSQAQWLAANPGARVTLEGHADERGTREYNLALGERRANAAKNYLVSLGVDAARVSVISFGKERPDALGSDEAAWARNRRAVTVVVE